MTEYHVHWHNWLDADNEREAANMALSQMRDPNSIATVFRVSSSPDGTVEHTIDLTPEHGDASKVEPLPILRQAYGLLGDGNGDEWTVNHEYTRAIVELTSTVLGRSTDDRDDVLALIRSAGER